ncbi:MAG: site-specific integrase [Candidatus Riflebacteria bacterium]|nr:site-specific integrase [Candidatus Riflebacteria bacterium]
MSTLFQRNGTWYLQYYRDGKKFKKSLKTANKNDAKKIQTLHDVRANAGKAGLEPTRILMSELWTNYLAFKKSSLKNCSYKRLEHYRIHWINFAEKENIKYQKEINGALVSKYIIFRQDMNAAEKTIWEEVSTLKALLKYAAIEKDIPEPSFGSWPKLKKRPAHPERLGFYSPEDLKKLKEWFTGHEFEPVFVLALYSGMRLGELKQLKRRDVDLEAKTILICNSKTMKDVKSSIRTIDIHDDLFPTLKQICKGKSNNDLLLPKLTSKSPFWPRDVMRHACDTLEIPYKRFHGLRHTFVTFALASGLSIRDTMDLVGHSNLETTQRYAHAAAALKNKRAAKINFD